MTCPDCLGEGEIYIEEHLGDGVYTVVDMELCRPCKGSGMVEEEDAA